MPVIIPKNLPATKILEDSGIFVMNEQRAETQDIRPLKIAILNLMPDKITTETQLMAKLSNSIIQLDITFIAMQSHKSKNTDQKHLDTFYSYFDDIQNSYFDGLIVTGAPVEHLAFEDVDYWPELSKIFAWSQKHVYSSLYICWASQAALYYFYNIEKQAFEKKLFGVFPHHREDAKNALFFGMGSTFYVPHSRHTQSNPVQIRNHTELKVLASSEEAGIHVIASKDNKHIFVSGHPEYEGDTLLKEFLRNKQQNNNEIPKNYFYDNDPQKGIQNLWESDGSLFYINWINHYIYQKTDYTFIQKGPNKI